MFVFTEFPVDHHEGAVGTCSCHGHLDTQLELAWFYHPKVPPESFDPFTYSQLSLSIPAADRIFTWGNLRRGSKFAAGKFTKVKLL